MKKGLCEIVVVADRSGSMESIRQDAIGAFNAFLDEQQKLPGEALLTYAQFDDNYEVVHAGKALKDVKKLDATTFVPRGSTALLDAVGRTIDEVGERLATMPEGNRPERVLFVILTDGQENSSSKYKRKDIFDRIKLQRDTYKWEFIFLAAGQDAFAEATAMGIPTAGICAYAASDPQAHTNAVRKMSSSAKSYRSSGETEDLSS